MTTYQIAQFIIPNDSFGPPYAEAFNGKAIDWARGRVYLWNSKAVRSYSTEFATQNPIASVAAPSGTILCCGCHVTTDGYVLYAVTGFPHGTIYKLDPDTLTSVGSFGSAGAYPHSLVQLVNAEQNACNMACISVNGVPYALCEEITGHNAGIIRTDTMAAAGWYQPIRTNNTQIYCYLCGGQSGGTTGTFYTLEQNQNSKTAIVLNKITVSAGAENWVISQWPTQNPSISMDSFTITPTMVDATWTTIGSWSVGYDTWNDIVLATIGQWDSAAPLYLVGIDPSGSVVWKNELSLTQDPTADLLQTRDAAGYITMMGNGNASFLTEFQTSGGSVVSSDTIKGLGSVYRAFSTDDITGNWIGYVFYNSSVSGAPTPVSGTASSFNGWAMVQPLLVTPSNLELTRMSVQMLAPSTTNDQITLCWSDDAGASWSNGILKSMGAQGEYFTTPAWYRLGMSRNRIYELSWSSARAEALQGVFVDVAIAAT